MTNHQLPIYIKSLRLRTLPLSVSGIIVGSGLAYNQMPAENHSFGIGGFWLIFVLAVATTLCLQILSNLANELGDALKGTDADQHGRAAYGLQSGAITQQQIIRMIWFFAILAVLFGTALIYSAFGSLIAVPSLVFFGLGLLALVGAVTYTLGRHSYGYIGLGDLGVFLFFGLLSTMGSFYLLTQTVTVEVLACGTAIGLPCVGVLNLNNIRDMANDRVHGKHTFASLLGPTGARIYHTLLLVVCLLLFALFGHWWTLCIIPLWVWHLWFVWTHDQRLDTQMPILMFTTLLLALLALL